MEALGLPAEVRECCMKGIKLVLLDKLAAARFASVFRSFESAEDYEEFFASLQKKD